MTEIIDRKAARSMGLKRYFTGKPCLRGHVDERTLSSGRCVACEPYLNRRYYADNPEKFKEKGRIYRAKNAEMVREKDLRYRAENAEKIRERRRTYAAENSERIKDKARRYLAENSEKINESHRRWYSSNIDKCREKGRRYEQKMSAMRAVFKQLGITIPEITNATR